MKDKPIEDGDANIIEYTYGKEFQDYCDENGKRLPEWTPVGVEYYDEKEKKIVFKLLEGVLYAPEAWNERD